jgi:hypothetical protein
MKCAGIIKFVESFLLQEVHVIRRVYGLSHAKDFMGHRVATTEP